MQKPINGLHKKEGNLISTTATSYYCHLLPPLVDLANILAALIDFRRPFEAFGESLSDFCGGLGVLCAVLCLFVFSGRLYPSGKGLALSAHSSVSE